MIYLSWDIGIINLSYCLLEVIDEKINLIEWENIDISLIQKFDKKCLELNKNKNICNKNCLYYNIEQDKYYCKRHNVDGIDLKSKKCIVKDCKRNKKCFLNNVIGYCEKHKDNYKGNEELYVKKKRSELELISEKLISELDKREHLLNCDRVVIENQPAIKNPKMKSIQMIIYSYFLIRGKIDKKENKIKSISFLLASNKLKIDIPNKEILNMQISNKYKNKYKQNKEKSKLYCLNILKQPNIENNDKWIDFFNNNKKKDDLADTFLMNLYLIQNK